MVDMNWGAAQGTVSGGHSKDQYVIVSGTGISRRDRTLLTTQAR